MAKKFIFKLTPNNKNVIINTDVLLNGYKDVEYPIPFKSTSNLGYILDPETFKFTDSSIKEQTLNAYPIKIEIEPYFKQIPFYGKNKDRSFGDYRYIRYYTPFIFNENKDETVPLNSFKFIQEDNHDVIILQPKEQGIYNNNYYSCNYKITIKLYWSDNKSHATEINLKEINEKIGTYPLFITITPIFLLDDTSYYKKSYNYDKLNIPSDKQFNVQFLEINDTPDNILYDRDILAFNISVTFTDPTTQLSIMENKMVNVSQQKFIGKRLGYVYLKQIFMEPIDIWSPKIDIAYTKSENNEANPKVDVISTTEYQTFKINDSFKSKVNDYNYTHLFLNDIITSPTLEDIRNAVINSKNENLDLPTITDPSNNIEINDIDFLTQLKERDVETFNKYIGEYFKQYQNKEISTKNALKYKSILLNYYYKDDVSNPSIIISNKDYKDFETRFNKCVKLDKDNDNDNVYQINLDDTTFDSSKLSMVYKNYDVSIIVLNKSKDNIYNITNDSNNIDVSIYKYDNLTYNFKLQYNYDDNLNDVSVYIKQDSNVNTNPENHANIYNFANLEITSVENNSKKKNFGIKCNKTYSTNSNINTLINLEFYIYSSYYNNSGLVYDSLDCSINISCNIKKISYLEFSGQYKARYAKYFIDNDNKFKQIKELIDNQNIKIFDTDDDIDVMNLDFKTKDIINFKNENIKKYKLKTSNNTNDIAIQYKYCVNNLFNVYKGQDLTDKLIQVPRFGVYPVLDGYSPFYFNTFDYETDDIPIKQLNNKELKDFFNYNDVSTQVLKKNDKGVWYIDNNLLSDLLGIEVDNDNLKSNTYNINDENIVDESIVDESINDNNILYGAQSSLIKYIIIINNIPQNLKNIIRINGVNSNMLISTVKPYIFTISLDEYPLDISTCLDVQIYEITTNINNNLNDNKIDGKLLLTNDENEKYLKHYLHDGKDINTEYNTFMLLRANPKLSGNIKFVVDSSYNLYLDTFKVSSKLNDYRLRKFPISAEGNYPRDIKTVFKDLPTTEIFKMPENSLKAHKVYTDFNDQYETIYEYGAETNKDNLYNENMKILAPLHIGKDIPQFFAIFRYEGIFNEETYNGKSFDDIEKLKTLISESKVIKTFDLRTYTSIGQYLNNYKDMLTNYGQCYLQFIEQDYDIQSKTYRQGNNIWKGISIKRGILTDQSESSYFAAKLLNDEKITNKQEVFNNFIMKGFERNNLLYPNIINLEFMFNDDDQEEYSMHRYFGLYLTENDFINYGYIISNNLTYNNIFDKYDLKGNLYKGDNNIFNNIFTNLYKDRIFYAITNDNAERVQNIIDIDNFLNNYVKNLPENNLTSIKAKQIIYDEKENSFITLHFSKPIKYGEHFKFIALNKTKNNKSYSNSSENNYEDLRLNNLPYDHIVYEIIASNDERLRTTDNNISPYVSTQSCIYSENTYFYRMSFYTQEVNYPEITATLSEQIKRINACIEKFDSFIKVSSYNNMSLAVISEHDEMYFQHIDAVDLTEFKYDFVKWNGINDTIYTTNKKYLSSLDFLPHNNIIYVDKYEQIDDYENNWLYNDNDTDVNIWRHYVEVMDPENIKEDSISYFNKNVKYNMYALTNQSDYFDGYYAAFSNYCFETLGWRYNNIVKFINIKQLENSYMLYDDIYNYIKDVKYPLVLNDNDNYETLNIFNIEFGYLRNNIYDPDNYEAYTTVQQIINVNKEIQSITSPYNVNYSMICTTGNTLLKNNVIQFYKPKKANIAIMGINNIKDIDTVIDKERINHKETKLTITIPANETIKVDESDYRLQHGVMYQLISGQLYYDNTNFIYKNDKFIVIKDTDKRFKLYVSSLNGNVQTIQSLITKSEVIYKICDKQLYQQYNYNTIIPMQKSDNFYIDLKNKEQSELLYPIVPLVQCNWKSNGQYYDFNNILDVSTLNKNYEYNGSFPENVYTPSDYDINQYITNKIDNLLYVDGKPMTFKDCILNNNLQHPIKKLLIDNTNIEPAAAYYNSNIQSLEFIFSGIKFNIKLNSKIINTYIHLDEYTGFNVFIINDYDLSKRNEMYISIIEKFILLINHEFYIDYKHEAVNNIKLISLDFKGYVDYSAFKAPYSIDFKTTFIQNGDIQSHKRTDSILSLYDMIDEHNLWSSMFIQFDNPLLINDNENNPQFIQSYLQAINEYNDYITFNKDKSNIGLLNIDNNINANGFTIINSNNITNELNLLYSCSNPYIITKADGNYNHIAYELLQSFNNKLRFNKIEPYNGKYIDVSINNKQIPKPINVIDKFENKIEKSYDDVIIFTPNKNKNLNINLNEEFLKLRYTLNENNAPILDYLSKLLNTQIFNMFVNSSNISKYDNIIIPKSYLKELQKYINILITKETSREKLERYVKSFDNNIDIYIIPINDKVKCIKNTNDYNPLLFELSIPNRIKFNYGWFTPNTNNMIDFYINDELSDLLNVDLLQSNTKLKNIYKIQNYTGNKVFDDNKLFNLNKNYFLIENRSLLSTTWDSDYYRKYISENTYEIKEGHITGIDDKSFFGSRCMVIHNDYIELNTWVYDTANDIYTVKITDSNFNIQSTNIKSLQLNINLTSALFNHFINNKVFRENWNYFKDSQYTGMKNYINNTISASYNMNSNMEIKLYYIDKNDNENINIINEKPIDLNKYKIYEGYTTQINLKNNIYTLKMSIPKITGMDIYPLIKIYRK